ncbi:MAG: inverse autotransporter beta domain-containing protein, partial [Rhabdochlamydiaceae bacterium]
MKCIYFLFFLPTSLVCYGKNHNPWLSENTTTPSSKADNLLLQVRPGVRHIEGKGIGYEKGYTSLDLLFALNNDRYIPFLDVRGHVFDDGKLAANAGIGLRSLWGCRSYGINAYYDYRNTSRQHYNQVGIGVESLGAIWDFCANGYIPVGVKNSHVFGRAKFVKFSGHHLIVSQKIQYAMAGVDAEAGAHLNQFRNFDFFAGAGPYYFAKRQKGRDVYGGKIRLAGRYSDYFSLEVSGSYDNVFHGIVQAEVGVHFCFGPRRKKEKKPYLDSQPLRTRVLQPVSRDEIVVVNERNKENVAINPATGQPFYILFVDNTSHSLGTFSSPYPTLLQAQNASSPYDIIYVFPGDLTTKGMDQGFVMQDNQRILGAGIDHIFITTQGPVTAPAQSTGYPLIMNRTTGAAPLAVIYLGNSCEVAGVHVTAPDMITRRDGILGTQKSNILIQNNICSDILVDAGAIYLGNCQGDLAILGNTLTNVSGPEA